MFFRTMVEMRGIHFPPQGLLCARIVLFTSHAFNSSLHYIALSFFSHTPRDCVYDREQMESVLGIPTTSHICLPAHFHNEIEREKERRREIETE